jgi:predicted transcriptional regulator YdeE
MKTPRYSRSTPSVVAHSAAPMPFVRLAVVCAGLLLSAAAVARAQSPAANPAPVAAPAATPAAATPAATPKIDVLADPFYVIGLSVHTSNDSNAKSGGGEIMELWQNFMQQDTFSSIPNKVGDDFYVVYTDFAADTSGGYTYLLGARVSSIDKIPAGMVAKQVPAGRYSIVTSDRGPLQQVVPAVWEKIWTMTPEALGGKHSMKADYETYNFQTMDPQDGQVDVHVGIQ